MVGFIIGYFLTTLGRLRSSYTCCIRLGDRHGENILLDEHSGDAVHVDFNCLFEKVRIDCSYFFRGEAHSLIRGGS